MSNKPFDFSKMAVEPKNYRSFTTKLVREGNEIRSESLVRFDFVGNRTVDPVALVEKKIESGELQSMRHSAYTVSPEVQALVDVALMAENNLLRISRFKDVSQETSQTLASIANELGEALEAFEKGTNND